MSGLTNKQKAFIDEYFKDFNATRAAQRAGYRGNDNTLAAVGYENLRKPHIAKAVSERLQERVMMADEVLARLSEQARSDISDFVGAHGAIDWEKVSEKGYLIKKVVHRQGQRSTLEVYDSQSALVHMGRHHGLFTDKVEHSGPDGESITSGLESAIAKIYERHNESAED